MYFFDKCIHIPVDDGGEDPKRGHLALHEEYKRSTDFQQLKPILDSIAKAANPEDNVRCRSFKSKFTSSTNYASSFFFQVTHTCITLSSIPGGLKSGIVFLGL